MSDYTDLGIFAAAFRAGVMAHREEYSYQKDLKYNSVFGTWDRMAHVESIHLESQEKKIV